MNDTAAVGGPRSAGPMPHWAVLVAGVLATAVCLFLLFVPLFPGQPPPGQLVQYWVRDLLGTWAPSSLVRLVRNRFVLLTVALLALVLVVLPWSVARRTATGARTASRTASSPSSQRTPEGRLEGSQRPGPRAETRTVGRLQEMAGAAGIPWRPQFETEGGARGLLELVHALDAARPEVQDDTGTTTPSRSAEAEQPAAAGQAADAREPGPADAGQPSPVEAPGTDRGSWATGASSSIYTPTSLYRSERVAGHDVSGTGTGDEDQDRGPGA